VLVAVDLKCLALVNRLSDISSVSPVAAMVSPLTANSRVARSTRNEGDSIDLVTFAVQRPANGFAACAGA